MQACPLGVRLPVVLTMAVAGALSAFSEAPRSQRCPEDEAGARVRVSAGKAGVEAEVVGTAIRQVPSPDRIPRKEVYEMEWATLPIGTLALPAGRVRLTLEAPREFPGRPHGPDGRATGATTGPLTGPVAV